MTTPESCLYYTITVRLRSEDPNQHLKDFLKIVDSLDLKFGNRERTRLHLFQFSLRDQAIKCEIDRAAGSKLRDKNIKESWEIIENLALYYNESWNDPRDFAKPVKAIFLPQDVPSTSDYHLIKLENQVQRLMEAHLAPNPPVQVTKIASSCEICSGPDDTQYCMKNANQAFVDYAFSHTDKAEGNLFTFKLKEQPQVKSLTINETETPKPKEPKQTLEDEFKNLHLNLLVLEVLAHAPIYNAILDKYVVSLKLGKNGSAFVQGKIPKKMKDPGLFTLPCRLGDSKTFDTLADLGSCVNLIPLYLFKRLKIILLEDTDHVFGLADETKSYHVGIVKNVEVHIGMLKLLKDFYVIDMEKDPTTPLLVGKEFLATTSVVIDCKKDKIAVGE
uniref:DNA damage-inducible protein 1-like n=1 Tax=Tanacetum cinerariifolium TaxID=118510 RepID=A0A6L2N2H2_TANCI|nr:DNA damage-inducible protein 1-like [Tanacetum cinerariifolium]